MRKIFVGFSKPKNQKAPFFSWAIRAIQGTKFSHVYCLTETKYNIDIIYQASGHQVNFVSEEMFLTKNEVVREFCFNVSDEAFDKYMIFSLKNAGKPYGVKQIFGILLVQLFGLEKNPFADGTNKYVCSELVADILFEIGRLSYSRDVLDKITPKTIYDLCVKFEMENNL